MGGFANLGQLYQNVFKIENCEWKTKTPHASIRRIVQDERFFFRLKPGLWALKSYRNKIPKEIMPAEKTPRKIREEYDHTYYQGLLVEIGNLKNYLTHIPPQDKNRKFLNNRLKDISTVEKIYDFAYSSIIRRARTVDVAWFNERKMPSHLFEVEYSTDFINSLGKFVELQDFYVRFFIIADQRREREFETKIRGASFNSIRRRVKFVDFKNIVEWHTTTSKAVSIERHFNLQAS